MLPMVSQFNDYRILLAEGGRGGSKSHSIGRFLLYLGERYNLRIVCGRETQNSITESVHALLSDIIKEYQLNYEIQASKIIHREKDTFFVFRGFREQGRFNTQGLEGIDILWIDEGQAITKPSMDVILPTIRKPNSRIYVSMNRHLYNDPAYALLVDRPDCLHININYLDNKYCTKELIREAEICKSVSPKDFDHIWGGKPLDQSEDALFSLDEILRGKENPHIMSPGYGCRVAGFDVARYGDDKCAVVILQQMGALHWEEIYVDEWDHRDLNYTTGRILMTTNEYRVDTAAIDEDGLGSGPFDTLTKGRQLDYFVGFRNPAISYLEDKSFANVRTKNAYKVKDLFIKGHLCVKDARLIEELQTIKYTFDHNQRRILVSKDQMRKMGFKSPNLADSLIMAVSLVGQVKQKQDRQYVPKRADYAPDSNLFQLAGVR